MADRLNSRPCHLRNFLILHSPQFSELGHKYLKQNLKMEFFQKPHQFHEEIYNYSLLGIKSSYHELKKFVLFCILSQTDHHKQSQDH